MSQESSPSFQPDNKDIDDTLKYPPQGRQKPRQIPVEVFLRGVAERRQDLPYDTHIFGADAIWQMDRDRKYWLSPAESPSSTFVDMYRGFLLKRLSEVKDEKHKAIIAGRIVEEARALNFDFDSNASIIQQATVYLKSVDINGFAEFLRLHYERESQRNERFLRKNEEFKRQFVQRLVDARRQGLLPLGFDIARAEARIQQAEIKGWDIFEVWSIGDYSPYRHEMQALNAIDINDSALPDYLSAEAVEATLTHEGIHAIAGKTTTETTKSGPYTGTYRDVYAVKQGLAILFSPKQKERVGLENGPPLNRLSWLDEAITEETTTNILHRPAPLFYQDQIKLYHLVRQKGVVEIPEEVFLEAYFEDFDTSAPVGQRLPKWQVLKQALNAAYDHQFIVELDDMLLAYKEKGTEKAIEFMSGLENGNYRIRTLQRVRSEKAKALGLPANASWLKIAEAEAARIVAK